VSWLRTYRRELAKERVGESPAFARTLSIGDRIFYMFCGAAVMAVIWGFVSADDVALDPSSKGWAILFGFIGAIFLVLAGGAINALLKMVFTDRGNRNG